MVAEIQRLEDAARTAMGDYSQMGTPAAVRPSVLEGIAAFGRTLAIWTRAAGKPAA